MPTNILMPALSPTMEEGKLAKWLKKEGDAVKAGDIIAEIETDKATMEVEAVDEGTLAKILIPAGTEGVKVNTPIAVLAGEGEDAKAVKGNGQQAPAPQPAPPSRPTDILPLKGGGNAPQAAAPQPVAVPRATAEKKDGRIFVSPLAKRIAADAGVQLASVAGSGPHGRIVKADVEAAAKGGRPSPGALRAPPSPQRGEGFAPGLSLPDARLYYAKDEYEEIPHDKMRVAIAKRLTAAKTLIPHYYLSVECEIDELLRQRKNLNAKSPKDGPDAYKLSVNDFVVRAAALALMKVPGVNASWTDDAILRHRHADIGIAVALEGGLITPIIKRAEMKGLAEIANEAKSLAERARARKLKPSEYEGGSFAVSNLGMFGIERFTAVINPPHAAILAVGAGIEKPVVKGGALAKATIMVVTLSCDHRVIDGALGSQWLSAFKQHVEDPATMLL